MDITTFRALQRQARRLCRLPTEAEDLLQETLLAGLLAGRGDPEWLSGVLRKQAAMAARGAVRRRRREVASAASAASAEEAPPDPPIVDPAPLLQRLPRSARRLAVLALHGLDAEEIRWILGIAPTAFRQRLSRIRKALGELPPALRREALGLAYVRDPVRSAELQFGLVRRALKAALNGSAGIGSHDPDGHLLLMRRGAHSLPSDGNL